MGRDVVIDTQERVGDVLADGEVYLGAQPMTIKSRNAFATWAEGRDLAEELPNYASQHGGTEDIQVADSTLPNAFLAAVTEDRILLFSRSITGKPRELVGEHSLVATTLDVVDFGDRVRSRLFVFGTASGQVFAGESPINGKALSSADRFVEAWVEAESLSMN
ncbi:MAG: hypothetical protein ACR2PK_12360 [Acidimicrobiales bacterium]